MSKKHQNIVHARKFETSGGETKTQYTQVGKLFTNENGQQSIKLDFMPIDNNGWFQVYEPKTNNDE